MRIDKFLKTSRLIKRRVVAKDLADHGRVLINGKEAKPADEVKVGDILTITMGKKTIKARILSLEERAHNVQSNVMFEVLI